MKLTASRLLRCVLYAGVLVTARANRKETGLVTSWAPHLLGNTVLLFLPEIGAAVSALISRATDPTRDPMHPAEIANDVLRELIVDNPRYAEYVAPPAIAFMLAYPDHNLYKSEWANRQLAGMGLDSIPHAATSFALTQMVYDGLAALCRRLPHHGRSNLNALTEHPALVSLAVLGAASAAYETGEFLIYRSELKKVRGDVDRVAMTWSVTDTLQDLFSNLVGSLLAILGNRRS